MKFTKQKKKWIAIGLGGAIVLVVLYPLFLRIAANIVINQTMAEAIELDKLYINPLTGKLKASLEENPNLNLNYQEIEWDWLPLLKRTVRINKIELKDFSIKIERFEDGSWQFGDIRYIPSEETLLVDTETLKKSKKPFRFELGEILLENVKIHYKDPQREVILNMDSMTMDPTLGLVLTSKLERDLSYTGQIHIQNFALALPRHENEKMDPKASAEKKLKGAQASFSGRVELEDFLFVMKPGKERGALESSYRFNKFIIHEHSTFSITGKGFRSPLDFHLHPLFVSIQNLDSQNPDQLTDIKIETQANPESKFAFDLIGKPLMKRKLTLNGNGVIENFDLPPLSPFAERFMGYQIEAGKLNMKSKVKVNNGIMDSLWDIHFKRLELDRLDKDEKDEADDQKKLPIATSLMLLKDKKGDIVLSIPMKGDLTNPDLGFGSIYKKIFAKGATIGVSHAITTVFPPFKFAKWGWTGYKFATKLRFDDLLFDPKKTDILPEAQKYLDHVGNLMLERPGVRIKLEGFATPADLSQPGQEIPFDQLTDKQKDSLLTLANERAKKVVTYLDQTYQIDLDRLFIASGEYKGKKDAEPHVNISL